MKDLGELSFLVILGMEVSRDRSKRILEVRQTGYLKSVLDRFGIADCRPSHTPAEKFISPDGDADKVPDVKLYMQLVGSLLYAAIVSRPDISYAVNRLSRFMQSPAPEHFAAGKRVLRYLRGTLTLGITYSGHVHDAMLLRGFSDSDWAGDMDTRRSTTGFVFMLSGGAVSWESKLQPTVAGSSTEAEYMAAYFAVQEALYLRELLGDMMLAQVGATVIAEDNQGAIALANNAVWHKRTKHIATKYHFVRDRVATGEVRLDYIKTDDQAADMLTKALPAPALKRFREFVMGV